MGLVRRPVDAPIEEAVGPPLDPDALLAEVDHADPDRRRQAALGLGGVESAVPALLERVGAEQEATVRDALLTTLAAHDTEPVAAGLVGHLSSDDAGLRTAVAEALAAMPRSVPQMMPQLVSDPDHDVRIMTAMVLADLHDPEAQTWLIEMIRSDRHPNVVSAAIDALLPSAGEEHADLLGQARDRFPADPFLRFTVEAALPRLLGASA